jgi:DNA ligase-1
MLLSEVVAVARAVSETRSRNAKVDALAALLRRLEPNETEAAVGFLAGEVRQGKIGVGWATLSRARADGATQPSLTVADLDDAITRLDASRGPGSAAARERILTDLMGRATKDEGEYIWRVITGELRQGALEGVAVDAIARAAGVQGDVVRRALMLSGDVRHTAAVALGEGEAGLMAIGLQLLRPVAPMLASPAEGIADALQATAPASVEWKLDGVRVQVHRSGRDVRVYTRNLNDVTERLPEIVDLVRALPVDALVLDGEAIALATGERPQLFQEIMSRFGRNAEQPSIPMVPFFFDCLHVDGIDLIDKPLVERLAALDVAAGRWVIPRVLTSDVFEAERFLGEALAAGHEGVVVKALSSGYQAGRRGAAWRKVKPVKTLDLVVLAAEWGHGRRRGWLSNLHLGARDTAGGFVMVGKTFKGLTDDVLRWQTAALQAIQTETRGIEVHVKPELVVEIELDGVQASTRYPGGVALRFARVLRYRPDKRPDEADTIDAVRSLLPAP